MKNKNGIYKYRNLPQVMILAIIYLVLTISMPVFDKIGHDMFGMLSLAGVMTAIAFILATVMTLLNYDLGGLISIILMSFGIISASSSIIRLGNYAALTGVCYSVGGLVAICIMRKYMDHIFRISYTDDVTGVRNRRSIMEYIQSLIHEKKKFFVLYIGLDHFRYINDMEGYDNADDLLRQIVYRWKSVNIGEGTIGRMGGDTFVCVIPQKEELDIEKVAKEFIDKIKNWNENDLPDDIAAGTANKSMMMSVNVGIAFCPDDAKTVNEIVQFADLAMYNSKKDGKSNFSRYTASYNDSVVKERAIEKVIRKALDEDAFYMVYQPQFFTNTKKLRGFEALIRLNASSGENIGPATFIPVADKSDLIIEIGEFVLKKSMTEMCRAAKEKNIMLSINISPRQIMGQDFVSLLEGVLNDTGFPPQNLEIEITEYCLMDDTDMVVETINYIKKMGVQIAMDDFGTGYSSLSYLTKLPIDVIKVDKSLIDTIQEGEIVKAIITMGHALGCEIISEGVELESQLAILKSVGNDIVQGFIWGGPTRVENVYNMMYEE